MQCFKGERTSLSATYKRHISQIGDGYSDHRFTSTIQIFKDATLFFLRSSPNLPTVIPAMDYIDEVLTTQSLDSVRFSPCICAALVLSK
jgi:hypothetical protein